jgi:hypothetical protein
MIRQVHTRVEYLWVLILKTRLKIFLNGKHSSLASQSVNENNIFINFAIVNETKKDFEIAIKPEI